VCEKNVSQRANARHRALFFGGEDRNPTALLLVAFLLSVAGLLGFIWSLRKRLFDADSYDARTIFFPGEIGLPKAPSTSAAQQRHFERVSVVHAAPEGEAIRAH